MNLMLDAAAAISFMHKRGVLHCDIKSLNFLVCEVPEEIPPPPPSGGSGTPKSPGHKARSPKSSPSGNSSPTALPHRLQHSNSFGSTGGGGGGGGGGSGKVGASGSSDPQQPRTCRYMLKLADMGEARTPAEVLELPKPPSPSRNWAPPEILGADARPESYTSASDVFGLALVLSEVSSSSIECLRPARLGFCSPKRTAPFTCDYKLFLRSLKSAHSFFLISQIPLPPLSPALDRLPCWPCLLENLSSRLHPTNGSDACRMHRSAQFCQLACRRRFDSPLSRVGPRTRQSAAARQIWSRCSKAP